VVVEPDFWSGRRVLVTGHTGFKGAWLALWLHSLGARVSGLANGVPTEPSLFAIARVAEIVEHVEADVRDADAVRRVVAERRPEIVIHMAAQSLVRRSFADPLATYATNVMGTINVFEAVRAYGGVEAVVNVTSDKCYENREWDWGYREYEPKGGYDPYSSSKGCAELATDAWRRSYDLPLASARAGNVIGGGDWAEDRLIPDMIRAAIDGVPLEIRNPDAIRPWQHVLNPLSGYLVLAQAVVRDRAFATGFNFGPPDGDARPVRWIVERLGALWPEELPWRVDSGSHPHEARYLRLDSTLAQTQLGWQPGWDVGEALTSIVAWYQALRGGEDMRAVTIGQIEAFADSGA
jgi:CDP-glucose 4,6-dehydratase